MGAYVSEAARDKRTRHCGGLGCAVLEQQPALTLEVCRGIADDLGETAERIRTRRQRNVRLEGEGGGLQYRIIQRDVGEIGRASCRERV